MGMCRISCPGIGVWKCKDVGMVILPRNMTKTSRVEPLYAGSDRDMTLCVQTWAAPPTHTYTNALLPPPQENTSLKQSEMRRLRSCFPKVYTPKSVLPIFKSI